MNQTTLREDSKFEMRSSHADNQIVGKGGSGTVVKGTERQTRQTVAIKFLSGTADEAIRQRFTRERKQLRRVTESGGHPAIVGWRGEEQSQEGVDLLIMDFVDGQTLPEWLGGLKQPPDWKQVLWLLYPLASALLKLHSLGIGHRDISPNNILVPEELELPATESLSTEAPANSLQEPTIKLVDFGHAKPEESTSTEDVTHTVTAGTIGTEGSLAPEHRHIHRDDRPSAFFADIYSFGTILFRCLIGKQPTPSESSPLRVNTFLRNSRPFYTFRDILKRSHPEIPNALVELVDRCLERTPCRRPTAEELVRDMGKLSTTAVDNDRLPRTPLRRSAMAFVDEEPKRLIAVFSILSVGLLMPIAGGGWLMALKEVPRGETEQLQQEQAKTTYKIPPGKPGLVVENDPLTHSPNDKTNLFAAVELDRHSFHGDWEKAGDGVQCDSSEFARIIIPRVPQGNYTLTIRFAPRTHNPELNIHLPVGRSCLIAKVGGEAPFAHIQGSEELSLALGNVSALEAAKEYVLTARVVGDDSAATIRIELNGAPVLAWQGDPKLVGGRSDWALPLPSLGIGAHNAIVTFLDASVQMDTGALAPLREFVPRSELPIGQWVQGLDYVDLSEHVVHGRWLPAFEAMQSGRGFWPLQGETFARLAIPVACSGSYEMRALCTWLGAYETQFLIPVGNSGCGLWVSNERNELGIENVIESGVSETRRMARLPVRTPDEVFDYSLRIVVTIGEADSARIEATLETADSLTPFKWSGKLSSLGQRHDWRLAQGCRLGVGSHQYGSVFFRSLQIRSEAGGVLGLESEARSSTTGGALDKTHESFTISAIQHCEKQMNVNQQMARPKDVSFYRNRLAELRSNR